MVWTQNYDPYNNALLSTLVAALPIVLLLGLLATGRVSAALAALIGLLAALAAAILAFQPIQVASPDGPGVLGWVNTMLSAAGYGAAFGLFPIGWIVLAAIFLYTLTVETGQFEIVKQSVLLVVGGSAHSGAIDRLLFRRVRGGRGGLRHAGGHLVGAAHGSGLSPAARGRLIIVGQYLAGGLRSAGHTHSHAGRSNRPGRGTSQRDGGKTTAVLLIAGTSLVGMGDGRLAGRARRLAGTRRLRRQLRPGAIPCGQLSRTLAGGCRRRSCVAGVPGRVPALLAAARDLAIPRREKRRLRKHSHPAADAVAQPTRDRFRLGAVGVADRIRLRLGSASGQKGTRSGRLPDASAGTPPDSRAHGPCRGQPA